MPHVKLFHLLKPNLVLRCTDLDGPNNVERGGKAVRGVGPKKGC